MATRSARRRLSAILSLVVVSSIGLWSPAAGAVAAQPDPGGGPAAAPPASKQDPSTVPAPQRDQVLPPGWRDSDDRLWTTAGDANGFHLLVAESRTGYTWRTVASLSEPGQQADRWIGNVCLTGSSARAVVVYGPRHFTNRQQTFDRGGYTAVVDLADGAVTKLPLRASLAYHTPGCGTGETAILTQAGAVDLGRTRLHVVDTATGSVLRHHELPGQVTSAVPVATGVIAAAAGGLIEVTADGNRRQVAKTRGTPFAIRPDRLGGVAFLERHGDTGVARYLADPRRPAVRDLARGPLTSMGLASGQGGQVFLTGAAAEVGRNLPGSVRPVPAAVTAQVSTLGIAAVSHGDPAQATALDRQRSPGLAHPVHLAARVLGSGRELRFEVLPGSRLGDVAGLGRAPSPAPGDAGPARAGMGVLAGSPTDPVDADRTCAVPRNDARTQVEQPHWRQVEWAADLAVRNALHIQRPANWKHSGLPAWTPQGMFPAVSLLSPYPNPRVPAAILLGILAQESNLWQASWHVLEGETGNPLVGNFYGFQAGDDWAIHWNLSDCGYGVAQVTDGMRLGDPTPGANGQRAIAVDYATNIAAGLRILSQKWNQTYSAGIRINDADPANIENWFAAVWAYNSGINPQASTGNTSGCTPGPACTDSRGNWGLGWTNNPANPDYPANRLPFLLESQDDARNPQWWPYPEKVIGWAASPIVKYDFRTGGFEAGYAQAWWTTQENRFTAKPPIDAFCDNAAGGNRCDIDAPGNPCAESDYHCWWHQPVAWKPGCAEETSNGTEYTCGFDSWTYSPGSPEPPGGTHYAPVCASTLPASALIVDDVPDTVGIVRPNCPGTASQGTFSLRFGADANGRYPSKADFHQVGSGFDGHFYFAHTWGPASPHSKHEVVGTWTLNRTWNGTWARVFVHLPGHGAHAQQAVYTVDRGAGASGRYRERHVNTASRYVDANNRGDRWVSLGVFQFFGSPAVSLSNRSSFANGSHDIAFDAVAFQPLPAKPAHFITVLGDSYSSGEGVGDYYRETDNGDAGNRNACHRSPWAWSRLASLADQPNQPIGNREATLDPTLDFHMVACSGAQTENLLPYDGSQNYWNQQGRGAYGEASQLEQGYLDENTTLVTFTVGGNDLRWGDRLFFCATNVLGDCQYQTMDGDDMPLLAELYDEILMKMIPSIQIVLEKIHERAPSARIVLMGYPMLLSTMAYCLGGSYVLSQQEMAFIQSMTDLIADSMGDLAERLSNQFPVTFADPRPDFQGKGVCGSPASINGIVAQKTPGEDPNALISQQSFHPNLNGSLLYAQAFERALPHP